MTTRREYSREFKIEAVRLAEDAPNKSQVARKLGIHIGPEGHHQPGPVTAKDADHPVPAHTGPHLEATFAEPLCNLPAGPFFSSRNLGVSVKVVAERDEAKRRLKQLRAEHDSIEVELRKVRTKLREVEQHQPVTDSGLRELHRELAVASTRETR